MTRKKVKLQYIPNDSARKATFKKRKKGLMKKVTELTTLCGIEACAIIYSPYDAQPEVWPSAAGAQRVLSRFKKLPEMEQSKKMVNQEGFLEQRLAKCSEQLKKQCKENREKEMTQVMNQGLAGRLSLIGLTMLDLNDLGWVIDQNLINVARRVEALVKVENPRAAGVASSSSIVAPPLPPPDAGAAEGSVEIMHNHPQWFNDMMASHDNVAAGFGVGGAGDDMILPPFGSSDGGNPSTSHLWSNQYFP